MSNIVHEWYEDKQFEGRIRGGSLLAGEICDCMQYAILKADA